MALTIQSVPMIRQLTASVLILDQEKVLLVFHKKYQKWIQPGGHVDPNEVPSDAACREAYEETGLHVQLLSEENVWVSYPNAHSIHRPYACLLENIPAFKNEAAHQHIDMFYLAKPISGQEILNTKESDDLRWFSLKDLEELRSGIDIFPEVKDFLINLLHSPCV